MKSVPPRGSGVGLDIADFRLPIFDCRLAAAYEAIDNLKSAIGNVKTHPLPQGGTDLMDRGLSDCE